jgi:hypothetical protein
LAFSNNLSVLKIVEFPSSSSPRRANSQNDSDNVLRAQRKKWSDETAKRIHVVVRVRPMSMNEIKGDTKVKEQEKRKSQGG